MRSSAQGHNIGAEENIHVYQYIQPLGIILIVAEQFVSRHIALSET
jgi:hypothetical protein